MFNSFYYALVGIPLQVGTALLMALLLNQQLRGIKFFRLIFYLPVILAGGPAVLLAWRYMFASNGGFVNVTLQIWRKTSSCLTGFIASSFSRRRLQRLSTPESRAAIPLVRSNTRFPL